VTASAITTPTWGTTANCGSCHAALPATGSHVKHLTGHSNVTCGSCHTGATTGVTGGNGHGDGNIDVNAGGYPTNRTKASAAASCSNVSCHNDPNATPAFTAAAVTWGVTLDCSGCHGYPGSPTKATISSTHAVVAAGSCNSCHSNVSPGGTYNTATIVNSQMHLNGIVEGGACNSCHGYPPVETLVITRLPGTLGTQGNYSGARFQNYTGGAGVHAVEGHVKKAISTTLGFGVVGAADPGCAACHATTSSKHNEGFGSWSTHHVQVEVDPQFKFDKNRPIVYNAVQSGGSKKSGTCSNVACHFQKSPIWSTQTYTKGH
jgi:predicted CxxxxCH...CXXCH cytochrome family protein